MKLIKLLLTCMLSVALLAGCQSAQVEETTTEETQTTEASVEETVGEFPITIQHAFGETVIESKPMNIVTLGWANQDTALALGAVPVAFSEANFGPVEDGMHPWTKEAVAELGANPIIFKDGAGVIDFEAVSDAQPDVILAAYHGFTQEDYDLLSQIAPVVAYPDIAWTTPWRDQIIINATAMGMKEEGENYVKEMEALIEEKTASLNKDVTGAFIWADASDLSSLYLYTPVDTRAGYLVDLGLDLPESLKAELSEDAFFVSLSAENIDMLNDVDVLVTYGSEDLLTAMQNDPILSTLPAIQNGAVALIDETSNIAGAATPGALSIPYVIDEYVQLLNDAAVKVK